MSLIMSIIVGASVTLADVPVPACDLVDLATAVTVLGEGATQVSDPSEPSVCMYQGPGGSALLTVQVSSADLYDMITILQPHTPVDIGERGRYNVDEGTVAVQFVKGDSSVTISVRPLTSADVDYLDGALDLARTAAARVP